MFLNNAHHIRNTYIITPNVFSVEAIALINGINLSFLQFMFLTEQKCHLKTFFLVSVLYLRKVYGTCIYIR